MINSERIIEVDREELIKKLVENKEKHEKEYRDAMDGYKTTLLTKLENAYNRAKVKLEERYIEIKNRTPLLSDEDISKQKNLVPLIDFVAVEMPVPKSYAKDYDAAIAMAMWDTRKTLELSWEEFNCYIRDEWTWRSDFNTISTMYKKL